MFLDDKFTKTPTTSREIEFEINYLSVFCFVLFREAEVYKEKMF